MKFPIVSHLLRCACLPALLLLSSNGYAENPIVEDEFLISPAPLGAEWFGRAVAVSGDLMVVGADHGGSGAGSEGRVYVLQRFGSFWLHMAVLQHPSPDVGDKFGYSVAIDGGRIVVGAPGDDCLGAGTIGDPTNNGLADSGAVVVFEGSWASWTQVAYLKASLTGAGDEFGHSVALHGRTLIVGSFKEDSDAMGVNGSQSNNNAVNSGAAYVFYGSGTTWSQQAYLKASNTEAGEEFGNAVSIHGDTALVGAWKENGGGTGAGAAYVYERTGSAWAFEAYIKGSNTESGDTFGFALDLGEDILIVGAQGEDSSATGIDGNQGNAGDWDFGAAYVFERTGSTWSQSAYVKASDTYMDDSFGWSVSVSDRNFVVGANSENSGATGINGNSHDHSAAYSGAAYYFIPDGASWKQVAYIKASNSDGGDQFGYSVDLDGEVLVVGAPTWDAAEGAVYAFDVDEPMGNYCGTPELNSTGGSGYITGGGSLSVADNNFTLYANSIPPTNFGIFLCSPGQAYVPNPGGSSGNLCLGGSSPLGRYNRPGEIQHSGWQGQFTLILDLTNTPMPWGTTAIQAGETWNFQAWYRDFILAPTSNFTDGLSVVFE